ncbi:MAG: hypothetical protein AAF865_14975 [Pseudomonadota bacterium]
MHLKTTLSFSAILLSTACSWVSVEPITEDNADARGVRVYDQKPLLVVSGPQVSVVMVPNPDRAYAVRFGTFLAKHDLELTTENGTLSKISSNQDTTAFPIALVNLVTEAVKSGNPIPGAFSSTAAPRVTGADFAIFDIIFDGQGNIEKLVPLLDGQTFRKMSSGTGDGGGAPSGGNGGTSTPPTQ